jgi:hypothetical protein
VQVYETFSQRMKRQQQAGKADVYQYDILPDKFRNQVYHLLKRAAGTYHSRIGRGVNPIWHTIHDMILDAEGLLSLEGGGYYSPKDRRETCLNYLLKAPTAQALNFIELVFRAICKMRLSSDSRRYYSVVESGEDAVDELNARFKENGLGYEFVNGDLIRIDSTFIHEEAVKPAIALLSGAGFKGANEEFSKAHEFYIAGENKAAITEATKAVESTIKAICDERTWVYNSTDAGSKLIDVVKTNGLIPPYMESQLTGLLTIRNKISAHGQGAQQVDAADHIASYALHLAAATIVVLMKAHNALPPPPPVTAII